MNVEIIYEKGRPDAYQVDSADDVEVTSHGYEIHLSEGGKVCLSERKVSEIRVGEEDFGRTH